MTRLYGRAPRGRLELLQSIDAEFPAQSRGQTLADSRDGSEQGAGLTLAAEPIQHRQSASDQ
ncbi:hypothetical protein D3C83_214410 [compost metagenome]